MAIKMNQTLKQTQGLVMTPKLQQAINLLSLTHLEMGNIITQEMVENPLLEEAGLEEDIREITSQEMSEEKLSQSTTTHQDDFDWDAYIASYNDNSSTPSVRNPSTTGNEDTLTHDNIVSHEQTLAQHLEWQLRMEKLNSKEYNFALTIIHNVSEEGYLETSLTNLAEQSRVSISMAKELQKLIQSMDPIGCGSENLVQCLLFQAEVNGIHSPLLEKIINRSLGETHSLDHQKLAEELMVTIGEVKNAFELIKQFNPRPGLLVGDKAVNYIVPDVYVVKVGGKFVVKVNDDGVPRLKISKLYRDMLSAGPKNSETVKYVREKLNAAIWLMKSIQKRQKTIYRVAQSIVSRQQDFFKKGPKYLKPMILRDIGREIGVHDSTVSRVTTNKYMHTPMGIFELKYFFNSGVGSVTLSSGGEVSSEVVREKIKNFVVHENPKRPLSDQKIVDLLAQEDLNLARRTVSKYREMLGIPPSSARVKKSS